MSRAAVKSVYLCLWILCPTLALHAQVTPLKFQTYTTESGLLHNFTKKAVEDKKGFIWIVSEVGLSRFDGVQFKNFQHDASDLSSLPHNTIHDITVDANGNIWLATEGGLCYYNHTTQGFKTVIIDSVSTDPVAVHALCYDQRNDRIWFITDSGLMWLQLTTNTVKHTAWKPDKAVVINQLYLSSDNRLWIAPMRNGFIIYDIEKDSYTSNLLNNWVTCFYEGADHIMWIGHWQSDHLIAWNMLTGAMNNWRDKDEKGNDRLMIMSGITSSPQLGDSLLLLATQHLGVRIFNRVRHQFTAGYSRDLFVKYSLPSDFTNSIFTDSRGIVWVCTWNGLSKLNMLEQQFRTVELPFLNTPMFPFYNLIEGIAPATKNTWWLGVNGCGIIEYDPVNKKIVSHHFGNLNPGEMTFTNGAWIEFFAQSPSGEIWAGNEVGIVRVRGKQITTYPIAINGQSPWKKSITFAPDQTCWIGTQQHIIHFFPETGHYDVIPIDTAQHIATSGRDVVETAIAEDGTLWIGYSGGLYRLRQGQSVCERVIPKSIGDDPVAIHSLVANGTGKLYCGMATGLGVYDINTGTYSILGSDEQVFPIQGKSLLADKAGNIWIYTTHSLFKYDPQRNEFTRFTTADGIHTFSSDPAHLFSFMDNFFIGYRGAYTEFDPLQVNKNQLLVSPQFTEVQLGDQVLNMNLDSFAEHTLVLRPHVNDISFYFTGIDFTNSDKITFRYKMESDSNWREATSRSVTYTNLPPGPHTFQLQARNSAGMLNPATATFQLYITPALYQRWWFWPVVVSCMIGLIVWIAYRRIRSIRKEEALKTETNTMMAQLENRLLRGQMNPHFIFNSLNSIQKYIWESRQEDAAEYLASFAKLIRAILDHSRKESITLREEIEVVKLYLQLEQRRCKQRFDYRISVNPDIPIDDVMVPPLLIQPYIENAIWHGVSPKSGGGQIDIDISRSANQLIMAIEDNGVGREFHRKRERPVDKTSAGMEITQQRIDRLQIKNMTAGVQIIDKVEAGEPAGTTVIVSIPYQIQSHAAVLYPG